MKPKRNIWFSIILGTVTVFLASCDTAAVYRGPSRGYGPPAHAPAHGHRRKAVHGYELVYDSGSGLYIVVGMAGCYYSEGHFYRLRGGVWEVSLRADNWGPVRQNKLPPGLHSKTKTIAKTNGKALVKFSGKGKGKGKGKH